jgi:hypothetical protein
MAQSDDTGSSDPKPVFWVASSRKDLKKFPKGVRLTVGQALFDAQTGGKHPAAKPLKGFGGGGVLGIVEDDDGKTFRASLHRQVCRRGLRAARVQEEVEAGQQNSSGRNRECTRTAERSGEAL